MQHLTLHVQGINLIEIKMAMMIKKKKREGEEKEERERRKEGMERGKEGGKKEGGRGNTRMNSESRRAASLQRTLGHLDQDGVKVTI